MKTILIDGRAVHVLDEDEREPEAYPIGQEGFELAGRQLSKSRSPGRQLWESVTGSGLRSVAQGLDEFLPGNPLRAASYGLSDYLPGVQGPDAPHADVERMARGYVEGAGAIGTAGDIAGKVVGTGMVPVNALSKVPGLAGMAKNYPRLANVIGAMLTSGGTTYATTPGDSTERGISAGLSAGMTGVPMGVVGAVQGGRRGGPFASQAGRHLRQAEGIRDQLRRSGASEDEVIATIKTWEKNPQAFEASKVGVRPTAATLTGHPSLLDAEQGSRVKAHDTYLDLDRANAQARWGALEKAAGDEQQLARLEAWRDARTAPARKAALAVAADKGGYDIPLRNLIADLESGGKRHNDTVRALIKKARLTLDDEAGINPETLYELRKELVSGFVPGSDLSQAARADNQVTMRFKEAIDEGLKKSSGPLWQKYLDAFQKESGPINSMNSMRELVDRVRAGRPEDITPPIMGERPGSAYLARAGKATTMKRFGRSWKDQLTPEDRETLDLVIRDLDKSAAGQQAANRMGSQTASLQQSARRSDDIAEALLSYGAGLTGIPGASSVAGAVGRAASAKAANARDIAMAQLMQDPKALREMLERAQLSELLFSTSGQTGRAARADPNRLIP